ncbi:MAG: substrate-binding domain-containing protein [Chloroflexi bacterium]|nr:substrate-binding domain-containing protein [Chloroflexota bacterium]
MKHLPFVFVAFFAVLIAASCTVAPTATPVSPTKAPAPIVAPTKAATGACALKLSTTTSTADSGLLTAILPDFEKKFNCQVDVIAVGTGQAIANGQKGDADALLVHDRKAEDQFVKDGHAKERFDVMYNDFIVVGPKSDPAKINGMKSSKDALKAIMDSKSTFASRGDKSGTNAKELGIWATLAVTPTKEMAWYNALGQGMGETLLFSNEKPAYTISDRATWLAQQTKLPNLTVLVGGGNIKENADKDLYNPYGVMVVDPVKHPGVNSEMATNFAKWITSVETQKLIGNFGVDKYGSPLFYADSKEWKNQSSSAAPSGAVALALIGAVEKEQKLGLDALKAMPVVMLNLEHPKSGKQDYQGVRLNALLDAAKPASAAAKLMLISSDGFTVELALADARKCADCLIAFADGGKLNAAMPGMASNLWSRDVVKIEIK